MRSNIKVFRKLFVCFMLLFVCIFASCTLDTIISGINGSTIEISAKSTIYVGETFIATATVKPVEKNSQEVIWKSNQPDVLNIDKDGNAMGISKGRATIVATSVDNPEVIGRYFVVVKEKDIQYTSDAPTDIKINGDKICYTKTIGLYHFKTNPITASQDVTWSSSNALVASINNDGIASFNTAGEVVFTCKSNVDNEVFDTIFVNVLESTKDIDIEEAVIDVIENTKNSILGVANYQYSSKNKLVKESIGSGFVYEAWGILSDNTITYDLTDKNIIRYGYLLITNRHVVFENDALKVYIHMIDEEIPAQLIQYDDKVDLAVVKFSYDEYIEPLRFGDSDSLRAGQTCIAIGNPEAFDYSSSATSGIISYPLRYISNDTDDDGINDWDAAYIQHDAAINPGNSGGPLLDIYGHVIGINTMKFASSDIDNMGFSIPSRDILELLPYLEKGKVPVRAKIGVTIIAISDLLQIDYETSTDYKYIIPEGVKTGVYITDISSGSVADGILQKDDIMIEFNGIPLKNSLQLRAELGSIVVGSNTNILVKVLRNGTELTLTLTF